MNVKKSPTVRIYERKEITYGEDKSGGGSGSTGGLAVLLLGGLCWYRMRKSAR